jgi:hypothetical protein
VESGLEKGIDPHVLLDAFIVSNSHSATMKMMWSMQQADMEAQHILFQEEDTDT